MISQASSKATPVHVDQEAHQLNDRDGRVGVIQLDRDLFRKLGQRVALLKVSADDVL